MDVNTSTIGDHNLLYATEVLPVILFLFVLMAIGGCGNVLVCVVYLCNRRKNANNIFVIALSIFDLIICMFCIPTEILDLRFKFTFGNNMYLCKGSKAVLTFSSLASCGVLVAIAIDRYKNICKPLERQTSMTVARSAILVCCVLAMCVSSPAWFVNGARTVYVNNLTNGTDCAIADDTPFLFPKLYNACFLVLHFTGSVVMIVMYVLIWKKLKIQDRFRKAMGRLSLFKSSKKTGTNGVSTSVSTLTLDSVDITPSPLLTRSKAVDMSNDDRKKSNFLPSQTSITSGFQTPVNSSRTKGSKGNNVARKTTLIMFLVTVMFILSYLPYIILTTSKALNLLIITESNMATYNLFIRFHFINSAINPLIYSFCGQQFKTDFRILLRKVCHIQA